MSSRRRWRPSKIRVRLTLLYAGAFFLAGLVLVALLNFYLAHALDQQLAARVGATEQLHGAVSQLGTAHLPAEVQQQLNTQFRQDRNHVVRAMLIASLISLFVVGLAATGLGWLMAGRALNPLQRIAATARRVADRSLHERIAMAGPDDELKDLADTFDAMLERLDRSFDSQRRFVANASHELRTPLTLNRALIEVALDDPDTPDAMRHLSTTLLAITYRHERLIDGLLTLASSEQALIQLADVDLAEIVRHVITATEEAACRAGIEVDTDLRPAPITGDPVLLERLAHNLVDNAIRYNLPERGRMTVRTGVIDGHAHLTVDNTGPVVAGYEIPALFEPFRRLSTTDRVGDSSATSLSRGAGLGLSIVQAVAHAHGGQASAEPRDGGGLTTRIQLPVRAEPSADRPLN